MSQAESPPHGVKLLPLSTIHISSFHCSVMSIPQKRLATEADNEKEADATHTEAAVKIFTLLWKKSIASLNTNCLECLLLVELK